VLPLRANYQRLIEQLEIDTILLIDGGVDSLARGDEAQPGTFIEDTVSMAALVDLPIPTKKILACIGFGVRSPTPTSSRIWPTWRGVTPFWAFAA
jgi:hypothetical protein